jgi:YbgC/YbaW family acyl-CoA thioester hydrolase
MAYTTCVAVRSDDIDPNGHVRDSGYLDYADHARWMTLVRAGLSVEKLAAANIGPVNLEVSVTYKRELTIGDEVEVETRFEYPNQKVTRVVQTLTRKSDGALAAEVVTTTGLLDLKRRRLVDDAMQTWLKFVTDLSVLDLPATGVVTAVTADEETNAPRKPGALLAEWERGTQAMALLTAVHEKGWTTFLVEPRDIGAVARFSGLASDRVNDILSALVAHGVVTESGAHYQLSPAFAAAIADSAAIDLEAMINRANLVARQIDAVVRTGSAPLSADDALTVAYAVGVRPTAGARALFATLLDSLPEVRNAMESGRLLDVGSGVGGFVMTSATAMPQLRATTLEVVPEVAAVAAQRAKDLGVADRIDVRCLDARTFDEPSAFDLAFWAQPFFPEPTRAQTLAMILRSLRPGGLMMIQEMEAEPGDAAGRAAFALRRVVGHAQDVPFGRPLPALIAEAEAAGFELARLTDTALGRIALVRRPDED